MILVDSSIFIAAFRNEETHNSEARKMIDSASQILILDYVISEIYTVLKIKKTEVIAKICLGYFLDTENIHVIRLTEEELQKVFKFCTDPENKNKLSFVDSALYIVHQMRGIPLITFDKELKKILKK